MVEPRIVPETSERGGYVPNEVYTCGAMRFGDFIILPYAISDSFSTVVTMPISELLAQLMPIL